MADGEPAWIQSIDHLGATLLAGRGTGVSIVLATLFALVALGIMAPTRLRRAALVLAMVLAALIWIFGQDFGALATGRATDPNSGPLLILVAWCYWPRSRVRSTEDGGTMTGRLATADPRRHKQAKEITRVLRLAGTAGAGLLALSAITSCGTAQSTAGATSAATSATSSTSAPPSSRSTPSSMARAAAMIHISSFKYAVPASVAPGATVSVMNMDGENHTVTADSGNAFDVMATAGTTVTFTAPKKPGTYPFHCTYHSNMHGVLVVK
jgi:plastocyanin